MRKILTALATTAVALAGCGGGASASPGAGPANLRSQRPPSDICRLLAPDIAADFGTSVSAVESAPCSGPDASGNEAEWDLGNVTQPSVAIIIDVIDIGKPHPLSYWQHYRGTFSVQGKPAGIITDPDMGITTLVPHGNVGSITLYTQIQFGNDVTTSQLLAGAEKFTQQAAHYYSDVTQP